MKLINGQEIQLNIISEAAKKHFTDPYNYTKEIIQEWDGLPYSKYIKPGSVILDIGANVGLFALHVLPYASRMVCVEPTPQHMEIQKEMLNDYKSKEYPFPNDNIFRGIKITRIEHEQSALNYYTGKARFRNEPINTTMNTLRNAPDSYEVNCITLKDLCEKYELPVVDFCKIDIEGSEFQALTVERIKEVAGIIRSFFVELHPRSIESQCEMANRFEAAGYKVELVDYNGSVYCYL